MASEWYLSEYENKTYLHNKVLSFRQFSSSDGTHRHCELCWARFSNHPTDLQNGYYEPSSKSWICAYCYNELGALFGWTVSDNGEL